MNRTVDRLLLVSRRYITNLTGENVGRELMDIEQRKQLNQAIPKECNRENEASLVGGNNVSKRRRHKKIGKRANGGGG